MNLMISVHPNFCGILVAGSKSASTPRFEGPTLSGGSVKLTGPRASPIIRRSFELTIQSGQLEGGLCLSHFNSRPT